MVAYMSHFWGQGGVMGQKRPMESPAVWHLPFSDFQWQLVRP